MAVEPMESLQWDYLRTRRRRDGVPLTIPKKGSLLVLLGHKRTFWCRIVLWDHASLRQAHKRSASRHI